MENFLFGTNFEEMIGTLYKYPKVPKVTHITKSSRIHPRYYSSNARGLNVCIVGSGPSGFYAAESILKSEPSAEVDILEKLPIPYGLVRYGVAPDHPEVKIVSNKFEELALNKRCRWFGNINVGKDVSVDELKKFYHAIVFAAGASTDRTLGIPGEKLAGVHAARDFVGWLNGHPDYRNLSFDFSNSKNAVIIGHGNVALDVARILLKTPEELKSTDITEYALECLRKSKIKNIHLIGRRGPAQAAFTTKELRELLHVENTNTYVYKSDLAVNSQSEEEIKSERGKKRMLELLNKANIVETEDMPPSEKKSVFMHFLWTPLGFQGDSALKSLQVEKNKLEGPAGKQKAIGTGVTKSIPCDVAFRSIGYMSELIPGVPFDSKLGIIPNEKGRVIDTSNPEAAHGIYACGWIKRGPSGIIGTNKWCAEDTALSLIEDIKSQKHLNIPTSPILGSAGLEKLLETRTHPVSFQHWKHIENMEKEQGVSLGKEREKMTSTAEILKIIKSIK